MLTVGVLILHSLLNMAHVMSFDFLSGENTRMLVAINE